MKSFSIESSHPDSQTIQLTIIGEFQGMDAAQYEKELLKELRLCKARLVIDLSRVPYIDSTAISIFTTCVREAKNLERKIIFRSPNDNIRRILKITNLQDYLEIG